MYKKIIFMIFYLYIQNSYASSIEETCSSLEQTYPQINVETNYENNKIVLDLSKNSQELTNLSNNNFAASNPKYKTNGLTITKTETKQQFQMNIYFNKEKNIFCGKITNVNIIYGFSNPIKVYINNEITNNQCKYDIVYKHEMTHVNIYVNNIMNNLNAIKTNIKNNISNNTIIFGNNEETLKNKAMELIAQSVKNITNKIEEKIKNENNSIDTIESYNNTSKLINNCDKN